MKKLLFVVLMFLSVNCYGQGWQDLDISTRSYVTENYEYCISEDYDISCSSCGGTCRVYEIVSPPPKPAIKKIKDTECENYFTPVVCVPAIYRCRHYQVRCGNCYKKTNFWR